jgi:hypothetical protein
MQDAEGIVGPAPPVGEQIHMPAPSRLPILNAIGLSIAVVCITISWIGVIAGLVLFFITTIIWIRAASRELDELPAEHDGH